MRLAALAGCVKPADVLRFAEELTPQQLDRWIATGITSWPELLANGFTAVARACGSKIRTDALRHWEPPEEVSEELAIAQIKTHYCGGTDG